MAAVTVLGAGAWGTAFGQVLADAGNQVTMWAIEPEIVDAINTLHQNPVRLPVVKRLPDSMHATLDRGEAVKNAEIIIVTIAAQFARQALEEFRDLIPDQAIVVSLMKGIERSTDKRMDQVVMETLHLPASRFACLSGPNLSKEVALRQPAAAVVASQDHDTAVKVATVATSKYFKIFSSTDVIGVEMCGSLKNVVALAVGMSRGAGFGENTAAMIETRGLAELTQLGVAAGAQAQTFAGLAGVGDLVATCGSPLSRNYTFGSNLGKGMSVDQATKVSNGVAEGVPTTAAVVALGEKYGVPTPLASAMLRVLNEGIDCGEMLEDLFGDDIIDE
ncbi:glycerol-3-phosphate dehydrogenase [NAD(P)+] [Scardovia inopinata]|uniref:Glycerol-3-phosphate dehydrogenase [NAD(P)+] n=1 Tax=Scardovia inopinata F0304 TaxID=641146 RepID=W5IH49_SCAIO|nr:NAD(P)H-dependent glycerol-3-phosphate dehydrogenase [Scardovia inopinata]EFG26166.1 glycerol-3-phosphate dehydrogenase [NAD(P)+] [Scardovia inopinata F0304]BAR07207.1 glycerol-3-phosphate dehydrogenase [Scardovia inopinata JCM 12537]SUV51276.1 glycerol-3-phosphate dehydrogenase [NAD(P)+] [Scardovia inopinata]